MFENIIGQQRVVEEIEKEILTGSLPGAMLFSGEHYSGKMSVALELARILSCTGDRNWNCPCRSCENHRQLNHPYLQILGSSFFMDEILTCAEILKESQPLYARYMFIRSVRKLLKRFDPVLWEGSEPKYKQVVANAVKAEDLLREIRIDDDGVDPQVLGKNVDRIVNECAKITDIYNSGNIPIDQVRRINSWAHTASESVKIVIFENADAMGDSSRNSMLKLLEEPPNGCYFILTTSRKGAIIPTILSRVRVLNFPQRTVEESAEVIGRIFREKNTMYRSIREYFLSRKADTGLLRELSAKFVNALLDGNPPKTPDEAGDFKAVYNGKHFFELFIQECIELIREDFQKGNIEVRKAEQLNRLFSLTMSNREQYNQSARLVLESLYYRGIS